MTAINPTVTVGQLVAQRPSRARVFEQFGIDYCCGGKRPLDDACAAGGIDSQTVIHALTAADAEASRTDGTDWTKSTLADLIANILNTHHAFLRRELPRLTQISAKVRDVHGARHPEMVEVDAIYAGLRTELEAHMMKEELVLFPLIQQMESSGQAVASHCGSVKNPIRMMESEHDSAGAALVQMQTLTGDYTPPMDACNTFRALLSGLAELEADLHQHIHKENNILFPRAVELEAALAGSAVGDECACEPETAMGAPRGVRPERA